MMGKSEKTKKISMEGISKRFKIGFRKRDGFLRKIIGMVSGREPKRIIKALDNVSVSVYGGEVLGIVGENGGGKSTLLRIMAGIYKADSGRGFVRGKVVSLLNLGAGLKTRLSMRDNIFLVGSLFGLSKKEIKRSFKSIVGFSDLGGFEDTKLYQFSEGMKERLAFSITIHCKPDILLLDEVFAVGDEEFRVKSAEKIKHLASSGAAVVFVSHELWMIEKFCDRVIWIEGGKIKKRGGSQEIVKEYEVFMKNNG